MRRVISGGVTAPLGFKANGIYSGIKKSRKKDLMLLVSDTPCKAVGVFTTNKVKASCVDFNLKQLKDNRAQAIIANSGNANCLTGPVGRTHTQQMAASASRAARVPRKDVLVASTGVIGQRLPIRNMLSSIRELAGGLTSKASGSEAAAHAILTTDRVIKEVAVEMRLGGRVVRMGAIAKGSGMIHPEMTATGQKHATMLCFVTTDAQITEGVMRSALREVVGKTFNMITVDADQSTNDMALLLANGRARNRLIREGTPEARQFRLALEQLCAPLAKAMIRDAEGATKFVEIAVKHAKSSKDARTVGLAVASSYLVKTALFGCDPNWGRIAAAVGASASEVHPKNLRIHLGPYVVLNGDRRTKHHEAELKKLFKRKQIRITIDLGVGKAKATVWTSDLSTKYVRINAAYRT